MLMLLGNKNDLTSEREVTTENGQEVGVVCEVGVYVRWVYLGCVYTILGGRFVHVCEVGVVLLLQPHMHTHTSHHTPSRTVYTYLRFCVTLSTFLVMFHYYVRILYTEKSHN